MLGNMKPMAHKCFKIWSK